MWPREPTARSGDIVARYGRQRQSQSLWVLTRGTARSGSTRETQSLWLPNRLVLVAVRPVRPPRTAFDAV